MPEDLPLKCQNCGKSIKAIYVYCPHCGKRASDGKGNFDSAIRSNVFEVIVRQALAGAPWREICAGPMLVNNITFEEIEEEVRRRRGDDGIAGAGVPKNPKPQPRADETELS